MYFLFPKLALLRPKKNYDILDSFGAIIQLRPEQLSFCLTPKSVLPTEYSRNPPPKTHLEEVGVPEGGGEAEDVVPLGVLRYGLRGEIKALKKSFKMYCILLDNNKICFGTFLIVVDFWVH